MTRLRNLMGFNSNLPQLVWDRKALLLLFCIMIPRLFNSQNFFFALDC
uniref:Uncharacterized protein n=1 Tax=Arundo donax TaxID=35708 RepID=A0A0A9BZ57_ARUDO